MDVKTKPLKSLQRAEEGEIEFTATFLIGKTFYQENYEFKKALQKALGKVGKAHYHYARELNTFMVTHSKIASHLASVDLQEDLEKELREIHEHYLRKITKKLKRTVLKDTEIVESRKAIEKAHKFHKDDDKVSSAAFVKPAISGIQRVVLKNLEEAVSRTRVFLWEDISQGACRLVTRNKIFTEAFPNLKTGEFGGLADELTLLVFSKAFVLLLEPLLANLLNITEFFTSVIENILSDFSKPALSEAHREAAAETARVLLGKILGIRETLRSSSRQVDRFTTLVEEMKETDSDVEKHVLDQMTAEFLDLEAVSQREKEINRLNSLISDLIPHLRDLVAVAEQRAFSSAAKTRAEHQNLTSITDFYAELEKLRFFTDLWEDIPYFTLMPGGIAFETEELEGLPRFQRIKKRLVGLFGKKEEVPIDPAVHEDVVLKADSLFKTYRLANSTVYALRGIDFEIRRGEFVAITGPSGSGKTTLLNIISGLDIPDRGSVLLDRQNISHMDDDTLTEIRRDKMGFIFQYYNLLPVLTAGENVGLPAELGGDHPRGTQLKGRVNELMDSVQLIDFVNQIPTKLSGGQMQRVTIARSMVNYPDILFADEPTGDLDSVTGHEIMKLVTHFHRQGSSIVLVTHDPEIAQMADRIIELRDGLVVRDVRIG
ncbi:MAG: ABC transporter ATP-binding protein [Candidatus Hodarchaeota archaeon]